MNPYSSRCLRVRSKYGLMAKSSSDEDIHWTIGIAHQELFYIYICTEFLEYIYILRMHTPYILLEPVLAEDRRPNATVWRAYRTRGRVHSKCRRSTRMGDVFVTVSTIESRCLFGRRLEVTMEVLEGFDGALMKISIPLQSSIRTERPFSCGDRRLSNIISCGAPSGWPIRLEYPE